MVNDADVVCQIAIDFQAHIESLKTAEDEYVRMLALFVSMTNDFAEFIEAYRARIPLLPCVGTSGLHLFGRCLGNISTSSVTCISWIP